MKQLMDAARKKSSVMDVAIRQFGNLSLKEYVKQFKPFKGKPLQPADDFLMFSGEYNEALLGKEIAAELDKVLRFPLLSTANHHGVDYFPPSIQGNLLFLQALKENGIRTKYLPVCSFGMVSLSNSSYARGITSNSCCGKQFRIPIFPKSIENKMVRYVSPFTEKQVKHTLFRLDTEFRNFASGSDIKRALEKYYLDKNVLDQRSYGNQAVLINKMLSEDMYPHDDIPQIIYMEMEPIINRLLLKDLKDENSLIYRILYDERVLGDIRRQAQSDSRLMTTMFFWGTDCAGRRYPLDFHTDGTMRGVTLTGETMELSSSPEDLEELILHDKIVPSGYTIAILLCFARGYTWLGGYFQGDYLPQWQQGTAAALAEAEEYREWAQYIMNYDCSGYICGPVFLLNSTDDGLLAPAGPLEIIRSGGIDQSALEYYMSASVSDAHMMALFSAYPELVPSSERFSGWNRMIGERLFENYNRYSLSGSSRKFETAGRQVGKNRLKQTI